MDPPGQRRRRQRQYAKRDDERDERCQQNGISAAERRRGQTCEGARHLGLAVILLAMVRHLAGRARHRHRHRHGLVGNAGADRDHDMTVLGPDHVPGGHEQPQQQRCRADQRGEVALRN